MRLRAIEQRYATEHAYQSALADWQTLTAEPEQLPDWSQFYANALQDALRKANVRRRDMLVTMSQEAWRVAVHREMQADRWYEDPTPNEPQEHTIRSISELSPLRGNGNGSHPKGIAAASGAV